MQRIEPKVDEAAQLLKNNFINKFTNTNVILYYTVYPLLIIYFIYQTHTHHDIFGLIILMLIGMFAWTFLEYAFHRYFFHWKSEKKIVHLITFIFHGVHHAYPKDIPRSITPLYFSLPYAFILFVIFKLLFANQADGLAAGILLGYLIYTIIHDSAHHFAMDYPVLRRLKRNHMRHHFFDNEKNFGVTSPLWDFVFRSYIKQG